MTAKVENAVFRNRMSDAVVWVFMAFATLYFLTSLVRDAERGKPAVLVVLDALLMLAFLIPAIRYPLHGVIVSPTEVVVRNIIKTHKIAWNDIERFEIARHDPWPQVGVAVLRNDRRIPMTGLQVALATKVAQRAVTDLNQQLSERTREGDAPAKPSQAPLAT